LADPLDDVGVVEIMDLSESVDATLTTI